MKKIRIIKNWDYPDLFRQTPRGKGIWGNYEFLTDTEDFCEYVITCNYSPNPVSVHTYKENVWSIQQEPPNEYFSAWHDVDSVYSRVYTPDSKKTDSRYIHSHGAIPWFVGKTYDELVTIPVPKKTKSLSFITSDKSIFKGHKKRLAFLEEIQGKVTFDLFGRGFNEIVNKWDALAPYKYSLAIENYSGPNYWSEKIADCFLAYSLPIYYGCENISQYFPKESYISIDIEDPNISLRIQNILDGNEWEKRLDAIKYARNLILHTYQFFPFFSNEIKKWEEKKIKNRKTKSLITIPNESTFFKSLSKRLKSLSNKITFPT